MTGRPGGDPDGVGAHLRQLRGARELTQAAVADLSGLSREAVGRLEAGHHSPAFHTVVRYCRAVGASIRIQLEDT